MKPRLFAELPAGLASVSLRLHGGEHCRPPISRMGNKAGYAAVILAALGLRSGQGASAYLWAEADDDVRALLRAYPDAAMLRRVAEIIRGWADEEPRALWERLRAERKARGARTDAEGTAAWVFDTANAHGGTGGWKVIPASRPNTTANLAPDGLADACDRLAEHAAGTAILHRWSFSEKGPDFGYGGPGCEVRTDRANWTTEDRDKALGCGVTAERFEGMAQEAAGFATEHALTGMSGGYDSAAERAARGERWGGAVTDFVPRRLGGVTGGRPPVAILPRIPSAADVAAMLGTPGDLEGCVVYADPPYVGTTGYRATLSRDEVVAYALEYAAMGAVVCVSEATPVAELVGHGWHVADIAAGRRGQKRTFSTAQGEFLTMNREPAHRVATQPGLFGVAA